MKKTDTYMKLIVGVLCAVVVSYIVFSILQNIGSSYTLYKAVRYEVGDGISTSGFVVRQEELLTSDKDIVVLTRSEGERVGVGGIVATSYTDEAARRHQAQISAMEEELAQMQSALGYSGSESSGAALDSQIVEQVQEINTCVARQDFSAADSAAEQLKSYVLRRYITSADAETLRTRIARTEAELSALKAQSQYVSENITVSKPGYFSGTADGFESLLTPEFADSAGVAEVEAMLRRQPTAPQNAIGRLITNPRWYYLTVVETDSLKGCKVGSYVTVQFAYEFYNTLSMRVNRIGKNENGKCVLVLTTDRFLQSASSSRQQSAEIIFSSIQGLRVPKSAIRVDEDGVGGVYVLSGALAVWKPVDILYEVGDFFIVREDKSSTDNLWPDDEIMITEQELYDGKVVGK